jgi:diaminohydroxyphosphoribosylaminopyrimidine deaminase/5-amino-6-(5-phosphoribosylamino)uracil reductase
MLKQDEVDIKFMKAALNLAKRGAHKVYPNPMVGCVIVKNGRIIAKGYHEYFGGNHAEVNALEKAGKNSIGASLYVNLEPCAHWGKTPPCADRIIKSAIKRVIIAMKDPNPEVYGKGVKKLNISGIEVKEGILKASATALNQRYLNNIKTKENYFLLKMASSIDGKIATKTGDSKWISGVKERKYIHKLRAAVDAVIVGVNTVIKDDPELSSHGMGNDPVRVVIDPNLRIPLNSKVLDGNISTIIIYSSNKVKGKLQQLSSRKAVMPVKIPAKGNNINFKTICNLLHKYGIHKVFLEGGGETAAKALNDKVVNEVMFVISPKIIGGRDAKTSVEGPGAKYVSGAIKLKNPVLSRIDKDFIIRGRL